MLWVGQGVGELHDRDGIGIPDIEKELGVLRVHVPQFDGSRTIVVFRVLETGSQPREDHSVDRDIDIGSGELQSDRRTHGADVPGHVGITASPPERVLNRSVHLKVLDLGSAGRVNEYAIRPFCAVELKALQTRIEHALAVAPATAGIHASLIVSVLRNEDDHVILRDIPKPPAAGNRAGVAGRKLLLRPETLGRG